MFHPQHISVFVKHLILIFAALLYIHVIAILYHCPTIANARSLLNFEHEMTVCVLHGCYLVWTGRRSRCPSTPFCKHDWGKGLSHVSPTIQIQNLNINPDGKIPSRRVRSRLQDVVAQKVQVTQGLLTGVSNKCQLPDAALVPICIIHCITTACRAYPWCQLTSSLLLLRPSSTGWVPLPRPPTSSFYSITTIAIAEGRAAGSRALPCLASW